jgi:hypothetical protein
MVLGGVDKSGFLLNWTYGIEFFEEPDVSGLQDMKL